MSTQSIQRAYVAGYRAAEVELTQLASTEDGRKRAARVLLGRLRFDDGDFDYGYRSCLVDAVNGTTTDLSVVPAHENLGPLPDEFRVRILRNRCGRMTRSGKPCRNGPWCKYHR